MTDRRTYTATGIVRPGDVGDVQHVIDALMDGAAEVSENSAVSLDARSAIAEVEVIVAEVGLDEALSAGREAIERICAEADRRLGRTTPLTPVEWHFTVEESGAAAGQLI